MKRSICIYLGILFLLAAFIGCSGNEGDSSKKDTSEAKTGVQATVKDSLEQARADQAEMRFPIRNADNKLVTLETSFGKLVLELYRDVAPAHADSFVARTIEGFYDSTIFHRVIENFMIQGGDPKGNGTGNAGYFLKAEFNELPHQDGTLSMARSQDPNSASSQFFICLARNRYTQSLDNKYTVFGQLIKGYDVLHTIGSVECVSNPGNPREISSPKEKVVLVKAYLSDAEGNPL